MSVSAVPVTGIQARSMAQPVQKFSVERRVGQTWRIIHEVEDDQAAAHLAQALIRQDPSESVRICAPQSGGSNGGGGPRKVLWRHEGVPAGPGRQTGQPEPDPIDPASLSRSAGVRSRSRMGRPEPPSTATKEAANAERQAPSKGRAAGDSRRYLPLLILGLLIFIVPLGLLQIGADGFRGIGSGPTKSTGMASQPSESRAEPREPNKFGRLIINLTQAAVARRYAYQSCIAENLRLGLVIVRRSYEAQRISRTMLTYYERQLGEVLDELNRGRDRLLVEPAEKGGLPSDLMRFIDDWFRLERDVLETKGRTTDIVNPEEHCRAAAERADYLAAWYETKKRR